MGFMGLKAGEVITLRHFSGSCLHKSVVIKYNNDIMALKPTKEFVIFNYFESDPIVIGCDQDNEVYLGEGTVLGVNYRDCIVDIKVDMSYLITNNRDIERFPTSLCAHVKSPKGKNIAYIRNISSGGMAICSRTTFDEGQQIEIEISLKEKILSLKAEVVWKQQSSNNFEYGVKIVDINLSDRDMLGKYLESLKIEQENMTKKIKYEKCVAY